MTRPLSKSKRFSKSKLFKSYYVSQGILCFSSFLVEFLLGSASTYAPTDTVSIEKAMFLFQVSPGNERIVAHGFNNIGNVLFAVYAVSAGDGGEVAIEGTSSHVVSSGSNVNSHHK